MRQLGTAAVIVGMAAVVVVLSFLILSRLEQKREMYELWAELTTVNRKVDQLDSGRDLKDWQAENQRLSAEIQVLEGQLAGLEKRMDSKVSETQLIYALQQEVEVLKARAVQTGPEVVTPKEEPAGAEGGPKQAAVGRQEKGGATAPALKTLIVTTDSSWRVLDAEMEGWTDASFNDGNWPRAEELLPVSMGDFQAKAVWFPEEPYPFHVFFRRKFEVEGTRVISGRMIVKVYANEIVVRSPGNLVHLYVNGTFVGSVKETYSGDREFDISPLVRPGGNLIAVEAEFMGRPDSGHWWALVLVVRSE